MRTILILLLSIITMLFSCQTPTASGNKKQVGPVTDAYIDSLSADAAARAVDSAAAVIDASVAAAGLIHSGWTYKTSENKMGEGVRTASLDATELLQFDFPYNGGQIATLMVRHRPTDGLSILLMVSKGQFHNEYDTPQTVRIKFDDEKPVNWHYNEAAAGSSDVIFLSSEKKLLAKLKAAKRVVIEAEFYSNGTRQMEFLTNGLIFN